jgi:hypothetical protein
MLIGVFVVAFGDDLLVAKCFREYRMNLTYLTKAAIFHTKNITYK